MSASVPKLVAFFSLAIHAALAVVLIYLTTWVPTWLALLVFYLSCEFTLLVTPVAAGFVTPLRLIIARVRERRAPTDTALKPPALSVAATVRRQLLGLVGGSSFFADWNSGAFNFGNYVTYWGSYH